MPAGAHTVAVNYVQSQDVALSNGMPRADSINGQAIQGSWKYYYADVASSGDLVVSLSGLTADADLYVRYNLKPTLSDFDCRPYTSDTLSEQCSFQSPAAGRWWVGVNNYDTGTINYQVTASWGQGLNFYTVTPCRIVDTRSGPPADAGNIYGLQIAGLCGIPSSAAAVAANVTVAGGTGAGFVTLWPANLAKPGTSTVSFGPGQVRATHSIVMLATDGLGDIRYTMTGIGSVHFILDVSGYFAP